MKCSDLLRLMWMSSWHPSTATGGVLPALSASSDVTINIHDQSATSNTLLIKSLVKEKRRECFLLLGGGAGITSLLESDAERGIPGDDDDVRRRKETFGENTYPKPKPKGFFIHVCYALSDAFLVTLLICAAVSLGFGIKQHGLKDGWYEGASIFLAVFLLSSVSAAGSHSQAKRADKLARESANITVTVNRAGGRHAVSVFDIVVGDVVVLNIGDAVPADGLLLRGYAMKVDESGMTDEPCPIEVDPEKNPFLASGAKVIDGFGTMLVTAVGTGTSWGEPMLDTEPTPLQERLEGLTTRIGKIGVAIAVVAFTVITARNITGSTGKPLFDKGIPLAATLTLVFSMKHMLNDNAVVRRLSAFETMGSVTVICTDKTGTLTLNEMKVTEFWVGTEQPRAQTEIAGNVITLLRQGAGLNTTGDVYSPDNVSPPKISGGPTEKALLSWAVMDLGMDAEQLKRSCKVVHMEVFNSDRRSSGVMIRDMSTGAVVAHRKGAAETVLAKCSMYVDKEGAARELGVEQRNKLDKVITDMAIGSLRCIALAYKHVGDDEQSKIDYEGLEGLTLLGLLGLEDRCRPDVKATIEACTKAGVAVKMVTGDNILTARAIATECGIISGNDADGVVIEGHEFRAMSALQQLETVDKIRVMARSLPMDKLALVKRLKQKGHVVAVAVNGSDDAPALKEADVGLSMGVQESSDIIILNHEFGMVVTATRWGRCVYNNIQKIIQFKLTANIAALVVDFVSAMATGNVPLTTVQLLWVNLIMDTMGALALVMDELATKALMNRPPIARAAPLISNAMWRNLAAQAAFQIAVLLALQYRGRDVLGTDDEANGIMIFNVFMLCQLFNEFNVRDIEKRNVLAGVLGKNRMFLVVVTATLVLQVVTLEVLTRVSGTKSLGLELWGVCVAMAALSLPVGWIVKFIPVPVERTTNTVGHAGNS